MPTLQELIQEHEREFKVATTGQALSNLHGEKRQWVEQFLSEHGFTDLTFISNGSSSIVLGDAANPNIVFRIAYS